MLQKSDVFSPTTVFVHSSNLWIVLCGVTPTHNPHPQLVNPKDALTFMKMSIMSEILSDPICE